MSSVTSSFAQKSGRSKFLIGIREGYVGESENTWQSALIINDPVPESVIPRSVFNALDVSAVQISVGDLFLDLGDQIVVYDDENNTGSLHRNVFRKCMRVSGQTSEGVPSFVDGAVSDDVRIYVKVFSAYGNYVAVARTG
jgi:hypothetical protein